MLCPCACIVGRVENQCIPECSEQRPEHSHHRGADRRVSTVCQLRVGQDSEGRFQTVVSLSWFNNWRCFAGILQDMIHNSYSYCELWNIHSFSCLQNTLQNPYYSNCRYLAACWYALFQALNWNTANTFFWLCEIKQVVQQWSLFTLSMVIVPSIFVLWFFPINFLGWRLCPVLHLHYSAVCTT